MKNKKLIGILCAAFALGSLNASDAMDIDFDALLLACKNTAPRVTSQQINKPQSTTNQNTVLNYSSSENPQITIGNQNNNNNNDVLLTIIKQLSDQLKQQSDQLKQQSDAILSLSKNVIDLSKQCSELNLILLKVSGNINPDIAKLIADIISHNHSSTVTGANILEDKK